MVYTAVAGHRGRARRRDYLPARYWGLSNDMIKVSFTILRRVPPSMPHSGARYRSRCFSISGFYATFFDFKRRHRHDSLRYIAASAFDGRGLAIYRSISPGSLLRRFFAVMIGPSMLARYQQPAPKPRAAVDFRVAGDAQPGRRRGRKQGVIVYL